MVAIKDMEMPKGCWYSTNLKMSGITTCPLKSYCSEKHIKEAPLDKRPSDCPLVEIEDSKAEKLDKIEQIFKQWAAIGDDADCWAFKEIGKVLEQE